MRKLIYFAMASVDGYIEGPGHSQDWVLVDQELHGFVNNLEREVGGYLYGRQMYELMEASWPPVAKDPSAPAYMVEFARIWQNIPKIVFSSTLERVEGNARLVRRDVVEEVARLKAQPGQKEQPGSPGESGKDLEVGGANLAATLMRAGLVDEYRIFVHPVVLGGGTRMIPVLDAPVQLRLVETRPFTSGVVSFSLPEVVKQF